MGIFNRSLSVYLFVNCARNGTTWTVPKSMRILKFTACFREGLIHEWKHTLLAPPLPLMLVNKSQLHSTHSHCWNILLQHCSSNCKLRILVKPSPALQATGHCHQLGLAYGCETWAYPTNTLLATVAFMLLLAQTCFHKQALLTTHSYMTQQHSTKLLCKKKMCWSKLIFKVLTTTWGALPSHILANLIINALFDTNADRKVGKSQ